MGRIDPAAPAESLLAVWNGPRYRAARRFFQARTGTPAERTQVCFDCPNTRGWEDWQRHRTAGGTAGSYRSPFSTNDVWSYFWQRTPGARRAHGRPDGAGSRPRFLSAARQPSVPAPCSRQSSGLVGIRRGRSVAIVSPGAVADTRADDRVQRLGML
ncbi:MAG: hypothetical protein KIT14_16230 [bacterium]|nr:hypothetical protein [bacterium]